MSRWWVLYAAISITLGWALQGLQTDDPYITYRFAQHLALGEGFRFNTDGRDAVLITTAPLYAVWLSLWRMLGLDIPLASLISGVIGIFAGAAALETLGRNGPAGPIAGLAFALFPLVWLTLGLETAPFLALCLWALQTADEGRSPTAGLLAGAALGLRGDGALVVALVAGMIVWRASAGRQGDTALAWVSRCGRALGPFVAGVSLAYLPLAAWLTAQFGSPLPTTLTTKSAQAVAGLTGFFPGTSFFQGFMILAQAYLQQTVAWWWVAGLAAAGVPAVIATGRRLRRPDSAQQPAPRLGLVLPVVWAVDHGLGYAALGVAPYIWYYAPLVPGLAALAASGMGQLSAWLNPDARQRQPATASQPAPRWGRLLTDLGALGLCLPLVIGDVAMARLLWPSEGAASPPTPPPPSETAAKILPEAKVRLYTRVGRWLNANTPPEATLGVTELGALAYWSDRTTIDFLGLVQPNQIDPIRRGDFLEALLREQPDYLALTGVNALYNVDPQPEPWFQQLYRSVVVLEDATFWGSPVTVWERRGAPVIADQTLAEGDIALGHGWTIEAVTASTDQLRPGAWLLVRLRLRAGPDLGARNLNLQAVRLDGAHASPVASRTIETGLWQPGEVAWVSVPLVAAGTLGEGGYVLRVRWEGDAASTAAGRLKVTPTAPAVQPTRWADLSSELAVGAFEAPLRWCQGTELPVPLVWRASGPLLPDQTVFVHVRDATGAIIAQADGPPRGGLYPTGLWAAGEVVADPRWFPASARPPAGDYALVVGLYDPDTGDRWPVAPGPARTVDGGVAVGILRVGDCR